MSDKDPTRHHAEDTAFIQALAELLNRNELTELKVDREYGEDDRLTVELSKHDRQVVVQAAASYAPPAVHAPAALPAPAGNGVAAQNGNPASDPASHPGAVASPMVGTAYLSPEPGAAPFVSIGQQVAEGDTLMIVEAMKTMNHIPAPRAGTVRRVLVEDGTPVEFGTTLMIVE